MAQAPSRPGRFCPHPLRACGTASGRLGGPRRGSHTGLQVPPSEPSGRQTRLQVFQAKEVGAGVGRTVGGRADDQESAARSAAAGSHGCRWTRGPNAEGGGARARAPGHPGGLGPSSLGRRWRGSHCWRKPARRKRGDAREPLPPALCSSRASRWLIDQSLPQQMVCVLCAVEYYSGFIF